MLYDRPYMRSVPGQRDIPYLYWILGVTAAGFIIQNIVEVWLGNVRFMQDWFALGMQQILAGRVWTILTYSLLHGGILHLLFNGLLIFFMGRALQPMISQKRILYVYLFAVILGGLVFLGVHYYGGPPAVGASAGAIGLLTLFCLVQPDRPITFLIFFVLPVTVKPRWLLWAVLAYEGLSFIFMELPASFGKAGSTNIAYSSHLGGILAGFLYFRFALRPGYSTASGVSQTKKMNIEPPQWMKRKAKTKTNGRGFKLNMSNRSELKKEVDRILDKINTKGFGALSDEEKETLDRAKDILKN